MASCWKVLKKLKTLEKTSKKSENEVAVVLDTKQSSKYKK